MVINTLKKIRIGNWTVSPLKDGTLDLNYRMFVGIEEAVMRKQMEEAKIECVDDLIVRTDVNAFLVDMGDLRVLVDSGCGILRERGGLLIEQMRSAGYDPALIDWVLLTHLHPDHVGGMLTPNGAPAFPKATLCVSSVEAAYWRDPQEESIANEKSKPCFSLARKMLAPYEERGKLHLFEKGETIMPGVVAVDASGHTVGHTAYLFSSQKDKFLVWGDIVHSLGIQFAHPKWYVIYDMDGKKAVENRESLFLQAAEERFLVGAAHLPHSGLGRVVRLGNNFTWTSI